MTYRVYIRAAAENDVTEAQTWYEEQQPGLATQFNTEFTATLDRLADNPLMYPARYRRVRRAILHRFPFLVWYRIQRFDVVVLACTHGKADPGKLPSRLR